MTSETTPSQQLAEARAASAEARDNHRASIAAIRLYEKQIQEHATAVLQAKRAYASANAQYLENLAGAKGAPVSQADLAMLKEKYEALHTESGSHADVLAAMKERSAKAQEHIFFMTSNERQTLEGLQRWREPYMRKIALQKLAEGLRAWKTYAAFTGDVGLSLARATGSDTTSGALQKLGVQHETFEPASRNGERFQLTLEQRNAILDADDRDLVELMAVGVLSQPEGDTEPDDEVA